MCTPMTSSKSKGTQRGTPRSILRGTPRSRPNAHQDDKIGSMMNVQVQVKPNQDVSSKSRCPMSLTIHDSEEDDEEDVKNDEEVKDDVDDVYDSMTKEVGSSYNSPNVNIHDRVKISVEGEVDDEPGGNVSARSRRLRFRQSLFETYFYFHCDENHTCLEMAHRKSHQSQQCWATKSNLVAS